MCRIDIREASIRDVTFVLTAIILVIAIFIIYIKRHIERMRFQISTVPGIPYSQGVKKAMFNEIEECLSIVASIRKEPQLLIGRPVDMLSGGNIGNAAAAGGANNNSDIVARMKTVDAMKQLDAALAQVASSLRRRPFADIRRHLCDPRITAGPLKLASLDVINDFVSLYEHARYDPGHYGQEKLVEFNELLKQLLYSINSHSSSSTVPTATMSAPSGKGGATGSSGGAGSTLLTTQEERLLPLSSAVRRPLLADSGS